MSPDQYLWVSWFCIRSVIVFLSMGLDAFQLCLYGPAIFLAFFLVRVTAVLVHIQCYVILFDF
jgi:hypothetical protein